MRALKVFYNRFFSKDKLLFAEIRELIGFTPSNPDLFRLAFRHSSSADEASRSNERLEYLGDAVLDTVISSYLFYKYPKKGEGFLTETRAKIVSRKMLGAIGNKLGLQEMLEYNKDHVVVNTNLMGNALEALIGAVFLDGGYEQTRIFIIQKIIVPYIDLESIQQTEFNYKSKILEWSQKMGKNIDFITTNQQVLDGNNRLFEVALKVDGKVICKGKGKNKKSAQKEAARRSFEKLKINLEELATN